MFFHSAGTFASLHCYGVDLLYHHRVLSLVIYRLSFLVLCSVAKIEDRSWTDGRILRVCFAISVLTEYAPGTKPKRHT